MMAKQVTVAVGAWEERTLAVSAQEFLVWLKACLGQVPLAHADSVCVEMTCEGWEDDRYPVLRIFYTRLQTAEEVAAAAAEETRQAQADKDRRRQLTLADDEELMRKFPQLCRPPD